MMFLLRPTYTNDGKKTIPLIETQQIEIDGGKMGKIKV